MDIHLCKIGKKGIGLFVYINVVSFNVKGDFKKELTLELLRIIESLDAWSNQ